MSTSGLSKAGLDRMHEVMAAHVRNGDVPGLVTAVSRHGESYVDVVGAATVGGAPMKRDTIFRISSMTKPITAVATLILAEECRLRLDEPVDRLLPELAGRRVLTRLDADLDDTEPARRPITVRDLLTFTAGSGMLMGPPGAYPIADALADSGLPGGPPRSAPAPEAAEWLRRFAELPLMHQPGEQWMYHTGSTILGALVERAAGQSFESFLQDRVFEPLGMHDTGFAVPEAKLGRLATVYLNDGAGGLGVYDGVDDSRWRETPAFPDGGADLVSTVDDYLAFAHMLLARGRHPGGRLLSRHSVEAMTSDQLTPAQKARTGPGLFDNHGYGYGVSVVTRRDTPALSPGAYGWDGGLGSCWANDPGEDTVAILLTQKMWDSPEPPPIRSDFFATVYAALDD
ncbi:serine hydrolase domain-containing protein [Spirilliplanes yamanashiensis]|uniref:Serine hydrolase n=1 Tax=Spirilliplanes yamanashiensis TaxID=42233 RepID=A0A8J4DMI3_9ACTN|nr:serine hydrolase domain-containing protein [Spirilliplanes yamanashiensis]MDP9816672.1 CubicO group peptidase (beta-lactamase class C family) [Spirilliplanes yamanashiensis]GIJ06195.1 serine hydrolase [Spirilliplanes yamanashiensis]